MTKVGKYAQDHGLFFVQLPIPRAYHSRYTFGLKDEFYDSLKVMTPLPSILPLLFILFFFFPIDRNSTPRFPRKDNNFFRP